jgi:hypothetical protein
MPRFRAPSCQIRPKPRDAPVMALSVSNRFSRQPWLIPSVLRIAHVSRICEKSRTGWVPAQLFPGLRAGDPGVPAGE